MVSRHEPIRPRLKARKLAAVLARSRRSQAGWAQRFGVSSAYLSQLLSGKRCYPGAEVRRRLLQVLDLEFDELFELEGGRRPRSVIDVKAGRLALRLEIEPRPSESEDATMMESVQQDLRGALRALRHEPVLTAVAALTLALGIGANTAIFTFAKGVFMSPLPLRDPDRLVAIYGTAEDDPNDAGFNPISWPNYRDLRDQSASFDGIAGYGFTGLGIADGAGEPQFEFAKLVSGNYFEVLGVEPALGRTFGPETEVPLGAHPVVVISHGLWRERFGGDPDVLGREVRLNGFPFTIIGVGPEGYEGFEALFPTRAWIPISMHPQTYMLSDFVEARRWRIFSLVGRLRVGVTRQQASADLLNVAGRLVREYPDDNPNRFTNTLPLRLAVIPPAQRELFVRAGTLLFGVVGLVLLITCANVANLMLARARRRRREIALRLSLGARRGRLVRQLLSESLLLASLGGALALPVAVLGRDVLWAYRPPQLGDVIDVSVDARVLLFTAGLAIVTGLVFGIVPALRSTSTDLSRSLQQRAPSDGDARWSLRNGLVIAQVALSFVAVLGAGVFLSSLREAQRIDPGFEIGRLLQVPFNVNALGYEPGRGLEFQQLAAERLSALPEVEVASVAQVAPLNQAFLMRTTIPEGRTDDDSILIGTNAVGPDYFRTLGMTILDGRGFTAEDSAESRPVLVANDVMAQRFWPEGGAVGKRVRFSGEERLYEVIGVARSIKYSTLGEGPTPYLYQPMQQRYSPTGVVLLRTRVEPAAVVDAVRAVMRSIEPALPVDAIAPSTANLDDSLATPRMAASLLSVFGALALTLAAVGIYGVLAQLVGQRTREIGIRMAIGARRADVVRLVAAQTLRWVGLGGLLGLGIALLASRWLSSLLYGVSPTDPVTVATTALVLWIAAVAAASLPASRAARIDPAQALRND